MELKSFDNWKKEHQIILEKIYKLSEIPDGYVVQKQKYALLTYLLKGLCTSKNLRQRFTNFSSLIILLLCLYKKNYPLDTFSEMDTHSQSNCEGNSEFKRILSREMF